jgi:hypothetical protein
VVKRCQVIRETDAYHIDELKPYKLTEDMLEELDSDIKENNAILGNRKVTAA